MGSKKIALVLALALALTGGVWAQPKASAWFNAEGKEVKYEKLKKDLLNADVILFGELHNNPICHWVQWEMTDFVNREGEGRLILGMEMFETDQQLVLDEYMSGQMSERSFKGQTHFWPNYSTDYKPIVEYAKENGIPLIATNVPRRYANIIYLNGMAALDSLPAAAKAYFPAGDMPLDTNLRSYREMLEMGMGHGGWDMIRAQAMKDWTMAWSINKNLEEGDSFLHFHGTFHSKYGEGIGWYLRQMNPNLKIVVIASVEQAEIDELEEDHLGEADYIIAIPETMTKTH
ncbi:MAG: ChaN family lipoprotein [Flavobacteriales bacterium]|nr:ChaN family lipoprotein [Flavobacteriales bacterium]